MENSFFNQTQGLSKNPLGIIALFLSLIYVLACLVLGTTIASLSSYEKKALIGFIVLFPVFILGAFLFLVTRHHTKLYAPSDFKDEQNFLSAVNKKYETPTIAADAQPINIDENGQNSVIELFLSRSSLVGLLALYSVKLAIDHKRTFSLDVLQGHASLLEKQYTYGYLIASTAIGAFVLNSNENGILAFTQLHPIINEKIKKLLEDHAENEKQRITAIMASNSHSDYPPDYLKQHINILEKAFATT